MRKTYEQLMQDYRDMLKLVNYYKDIYERFSRLGDDENAFYFFKQLETTYDRLDEIVEQIELIQN